jgi:hypothetical protein
MKLDEDYNITKSGVVRKNPGVMPYHVLLSINRAWDDLQKGRYTQEIVKS